MSGPAPAPKSRLFLPLLLVLPAVTALAFTLYTGEIWEDFFITFRHTENLVNGHGLVYQPGERVHGFTSVINTLLPALPLLATDSMTASLAFYRLCSLAALLAGLFFLWRELRRRCGSGPVELLFNALAVAMSVKIVVFTMNGQETGFLVGFLALALAAALRIEAPNAWIQLGISWLGLLYTRPDSPVYIAVVAAIAWYIHAPPRTGFWRTVFRATGLAAAGYLPWLITAWVYYGSPVPHTVIAKAGNSIFVGGNTLATFGMIWAKYIEIIGDLFGPVYGLGAWPVLLGWGCVLGGLGASLAWTLPLKDRFARACSLGLFVVMLYQCWLAVQRDAYPWYFGAGSLLAIVTLGRLLAGVNLSQGGARAFARPAAAALVLVTSAAIFVLSCRQLKIQQVEVEEKTRKAVGLWLRERIAPGDTVYLEPIGYIGYYSGAKILDYPGLVSPEVVRARHEKNLSFAELPLALKPTWIVARRGEIEIFRQFPEIVASYDWVHQIDGNERLDAMGPFPGDRTVRHDLWYIVMRRKPGL